MKQSDTPLWKKSMLQHLNLGDITETLYEIFENGDMYGYENDEAGYYQEYKEQFDELSFGANSLLNALQEYDLSEHWDDMTVCLLGQTTTVLGYDSVEMDYYHMADPYCEDLAVQEAQKRLMRLTKEELIRTFRSVMVVLTSFFDIKAAHDFLTSIVQELNERAAIMERAFKKAGMDDNAPLPALPMRSWVE